MQLGKKIRDLRFRRGLTVQQLAEASGLSKGFISQVENDRTSPSLATLRDLSRALETSVAYLVVEDDNAPYVVREAQRPRLNTDGGPTRLEVLSIQPRRNLEVLMVEIAPGSSTVTDRNYLHGEECIVCLAGTVTVTSHEHKLVLEAGDSCHFDARVPHTIENLGTVTSRILVAITPAAFEPAGRMRPAPEANGKRLEVASLT